MLPGLRVKDGFMRHPFDTEFGVQTSGLVSGRHLKAGHAHDRHSTAYYGVAPSIFREICERWRTSPPAFPAETYSFIDLGSGMGRALLLAAEMPFREGSWGRTESETGQRRLKERDYLAGGGGECIVRCAFFTRMRPRLNFLMALAFYFCSIHSARPCCDGCSSGLKPNSATGPANSTCSMSIMSRRRCWLNILGFQAIYRG